MYQSGTLILNRYSSIQDKARKYRESALHIELIKRIQQMQDSLKLSGSPSKMS
jgi:hypothetical protein